MAKSITAVWLGDSDPQAQIITMNGMTFIKGQPVKVEENDAAYDQIVGNPTFSVDSSKPQVTPAAEPTEDEQAEAAERGTEKAALKAELARLGYQAKGNPSEDTLRAKLAELTAL